MLWKACVSVDWWRAMFSLRYCIRPPCKRSITQLHWAAKVKVTGDIDKQMQAQLVLQISPSSFLLLGDHAATLMHTGLIDEAMQL